jgi:hypothetical protein
VTPGALASDPTHSTLQFSYPDTLCGFNGVSSWTVVDNYGSTASGGTYDSGRLVQVFTAENGRGVRIAWDAGREYNAPPTQNPDGSSTVVETFDGLNATTNALDGRVLEHGAGRVQVTFQFDPSGNLVSVTATSLAGNNPNVSGAPDCSVIGPYLGGS